MPKIMGRKGKEMSPDLKMVAVDLFRTEKKYQKLQEYCSSQYLQYHTLSEDLEKSTSRESSEISKTPAHAMDDRDYRQLEKIVKTERRPR
jgi:predicted  nucleic acid-binding Zn-ribbon protein